MVNISELELEKGFEITEPDFKMVFDGRTAFDLYFKTSTDKYKLVGYNIPFTPCLQKIIYNRIASGKQVSDLKSFIAAYRDISTDLQKTIESALNV